jgi:hypothetical protein
MKQQRAQTPQPKPAPTGPPKWTGPNGEVWEPPPPNSPVQMKPGWLTKMQMDVANAKPVPASLLKSEPRDNAGGSAGFRWNGQNVDGRPVEAWEQSAAARPRRDRWGNHNW